MKMSGAWGSPQQIGALAILNFLLDLIKVSGRESFTKAEVIALLTAVSREEEIFDGKVIAAFNAALKEFELEKLEKRGGPAIQ